MTVETTRPEVLTCIDGPLEGQNASCIGDSIRFHCIDSDADSDADGLKWRYEHYRPTPPDDRAPEWTLRHDRTSYDK